MFEIILHHYTFTLQKINSELFSLNKFTSF